MSYCWNYVFMCQSFLRMCNRVPSSWSVQGADSLLVMRGGLFLIPSANCSTWVKTPRPLSKSLSWWQPIPHFHPLVPPLVVLLFPSCCPLKLIPIMITYTSDFNWSKCFGRQFQALALYTHLGNHGNCLWFFFVWLSLRKPGLANLVVLQKKKKKCGKV